MEMDELWSLSIDVLGNLWVSPMRGTHPEIHARRFIGLRRAFVDDFPRTIFVFLHPVLAFFRFIREVIAGILLVEIDYHQIISSGIEEHANAADSHLDPVFIRINLAFVPGPFRQSLAAVGEILPVVSDISLDVSAFPVAPPAFQMTCQLVAQAGRLDGFDPFYAITDDHRSQTVNSQVRNR